MVYLAARNKRLKLSFLVFLALSLLISPLLNSTMSYADAEEPAEQTQDPEAPQNLRVVADSITATSATIEWDHDPDLNHIDVWFADTNGYLDFGNSGSRTITKFQPETTYRIYITWFSSRPSLEHKSNIIEFTTPAGEVEEPPATGATDLEVVEVTHDTVSLKWKNAPGIDDYWIWNAETNRYVLWANSEFKLLGGLVPNTTYSLFLGPDGIEFPNLTAEQKSNVVTFTTLSDETIYEEHPLTPPQNLKVIGITDSSVTLGWTGSPGADGYDYWINGDKEGGVQGDALTFTFNLTPEQQVDGAEYSFWVAAKNSEEETISAKSNEVAFIWGELSAPQDVQVVTANRSTVALGWAPTPGATSYAIYEGEDLIGSSDTNRYVAKQLTEGQAYSYTVVSINDLWTSPASAPVTAVPGANYTNVTYYTSWSLSPSKRNYKPEDIDVSQFTHINYAFADLCWMKAGTNGEPCQNDDLPLQNRYVYDGEIVLGDQDYDLRNFASFATIKEEFPHLKLLVSVGGWAWSKNFSNMAADEITRRAFAHSAVEFMREYGLDGIDIDWEYPVEGGESHNVHRPEDNLNFTLLMKTVREAFDAAGSEDGKYYLLTIASGQGDNFVRNADLINSVHALDFINIMTYDYSGSWSLFAHHNSPIYDDKAHPGTNAPRNNVRGGALGHLNGGVPNHKLVLGVPHYGKGWTGCPDVGQYDTCEAIPSGTWESGIFDYADVEQNFLNKEGFVRYWNESAKVPYVFNEDTGMFISYNDPTTMMYTSSLIKTLDIAGVMSWEVSGDRNLSLVTQLNKDLPNNGAVNADALGAPQNVVRANANLDSIEVKWDAVEDAAGYEVFVNYSYAGYTENKQLKVNGLTSGTEYTVTVLAIKKVEGEIAEVSPASHPLVIRTDCMSFVYPTAPAKDKDELDSSITKSGGKWTVSILKDAAIKTIEAAKAAVYKLTVGAEAQQTEITIPKEVIAAMAAQGKGTQLSINWNGRTYTVPVHAIHWTPISNYRLPLHQLK